MVNEPVAVEFLLNSGEALLSENATEGAFDLFHQALQLARQVRDPNHELRVLQALGKAYQQTAQVDAAIATLEQAVAIATATADLYALYQCHRQLAHFYKAAHNLEAAFHHLEAAETAREATFQSQVHPWFRLIGSPLDSSAQCGVSGDDFPGTVQERFHSLFNSIPLGLYRARPDGALLNANPALIQLLGFPDWATFIRTPGADRYMISVVQQTKQCTLDADGVLRNCEVHLRRYDGLSIWVRLHTRLVCQKDGTPLYFEGAMEDISETKAVQAVLEELATLDSLTHIFNRRHFLDLAQRELARSVRFQRPFALVMLDIDHFKAVNDAYGHMTGDNVLREVVFRLQENLRRSDILARFGGEEFILLMPETTEQEAFEGAERLRCIIAESPFEEVQDRIALTISLGLTSWSATQTAVPYLDDLISQADQALYQAKHQGRNQTQIHRHLEAERLQVESGTSAAPGAG